MNIVSISRAHRSISSHIASMRPNNGTGFSRSIGEIGRQFASTALVANDKAQVTLDTIISAKDVHGLLNI